MLCAMDKVLQSAVYICMRWCYVTHTKLACTSPKRFVRAPGGWASCLTFLFNLKRMHAVQELMKRQGIACIRHVMVEPPIHRRVILE